MRKFIVTVLMTATFLGGYYLGRLPDSPDIFGWMAQKYRETKKISLQPPRGSSGLVATIQRLGCVVELVMVSPAPQVGQDQEARQ